MDMSDTASKQHLALFFTLSIAISWAIWIPMVIYYLQNPFQVTPLPMPFLLLGLVGAFGPTFAALIVTDIYDRGTGIKKLLKRWLLWRVGLRWYLSIPLITISIRLGAIGLYVLTVGAKPQLNLGLWYMFFLDFLIAIIGGPIAEETGWRGFALPRLQKSYSTFASSLILGLFWTFWHTPGFLVPGMALPAVPLDWLVILNFLLRVMSLSVLFTWFFNNTKESLFIAFLLHAAVNSVPQTLFKIFGIGTSDTNVIFWVSWFTVGLQWLLVATLIVIFGPARLSRKQIKTN
jgi:membrane protease YdiL (CAAX protease family)